jgi:hypothetical protein
VFLKDIFSVKELKKIPDLPSTISFEAIFYLVINKNKNRYINVFPTREKFNFYIDKNDFLEKNIYFLSSAFLVADFLIQLTFLRFINIFFLHLGEHK